MRGIRQQDVHSHWFLADYPLRDLRRLIRSQRRSVQGPGCGVVDGPANRAVCSRVVLNGKRMRGVRDGQKGRRNVPRSRTRYSRDRSSSYRLSGPRARETLGRSSRAIGLRRGKSGQSRLREARKGVRTLLDRPPAWTGSREDAVR
jgi:hypothetical protein